MPKFQSDLETYCFSGSTNQIELNRTALSRLSVLIPSVNKQERTAAVLSCIDRAIEQTEAIIAKQQRIQAGLMQDLLTKGIDDHGNIRDEATHEFKDSPFGKTPKEWSTDILDNATKIIDCKHITPKFTPSGFPFLRPRNIKIDGLDLSDVDYVSEQDFRFLTEKHEPHWGDIVFSRNASFGVPCYIETSEKFAIGQDVVVMTETSANTRYIYFLLLSKLIERQIAQVSTGSTFGRINLAFIRKLLIPLPVIEEQLRIVSVLDAQLAQIKATKQYLNKLRKLKTGLMQDLLTGKVRVNALLETQD
jgi:type I restriction enzyme S subunit